MTLFDAYRYDAKRVLVVGGATGMGAATAELVAGAGAEVVVMDYAEVTRPGVTALQVNLADTASIDEAVDACGGPLDAVFACAGVADGTPDIERVNFLGHRHLIERALEAGMFNRGSAIAFISSAAGLGWETNFELYRELFETKNVEEGVAWFERTGRADYFHTKQAICAWVAHQAYRFLKHGIRLNATCPGPTDTPLAQANKEQWLGLGDEYRRELGLDPSTPVEQAYALVFLCSDAARAISGVTLVSDVGYLESGMTGSYPEATLMAQLLHGRSVAGVAIPGDDA